MKSRARAPRPTQHEPTRERKQHYQPGGCPRGAAGRRRQLRHQTASAHGRDPGSYAAATRSPERLGLGRVRGQLCQARVERASSACDLLLARPSRGRRSALCERVGHASQRPPGLKLSRHRHHVAGAEGADADGALDRPRRPSVTEDLRGGLRRLLRVDQRRGRLDRARRVAGVDHRADAERARLALRQRADEDRRTCLVGLAAVRRGDSRRSRPPAP